ncbi:WD repeat-containing protein jip5 [Lecanora helva]
MFDTLCTYPLNSDLFAQSIHPSAPILALGLASGHVQLNRLPPSDPSSAPQDGRSCIETAWRTRRHKGSCRSLCFSHDGDNIFSGGSDGIVKVASTENGRVHSKIAVPLQSASLDPATLIHALSPQTLLLATDSSALYLYDLRADSTVATSKPQQTHHPHDDYISSLTPLPPTDNSTSGFNKQWITTGSTNVAVTDLRRGILVQSEDLEEELLSSAIVGSKLVVGGERGGLRLWEVGVWDDNEVTFTVGKRASADVQVAAPEGVGKEQLLAVGMDDGSIKVVGMGGKRPRVIGDMNHDEVEGVLGLGFDVGGRMCSGGGAIVKVWEESLKNTDDDEEEEVPGVNGKRDRESESEVADSESGGRTSSEEEKKPKRNKKKRKRNKGKDKSGGPHVMAFSGLD